MTAFVRPKHVVVIDVMVVFFQIGWETWSPHAWRKTPRILNPKHWAKHVGSAVLHISLAQYAAVYSRSFWVLRADGGSKGDANDIPQSCVF